MNQKRLAVIRVRGEHDIKKEVKDTLNMLRLYKKNNLCIISNTLSNLGMLNKIKDYITWGELDQETFAKLMQKRARLSKNKSLPESYLKEKLNIDLSSFCAEFMNNKRELKDVPGLKQFFRLNSPIKGFERKGIKIQYSLGGSLGYRKEKINDLIKRML